MKAAVVTKPGKLELLDIAVPRPGPYDCLAKIDACAVCTGTDTAIAFGKFPWRAEYPFVLGHESTGLITEVGPKVRHFQAGQRVTRPAAVLNGERVNGLGSTWGGYAEWGIVRDMRATAEDGLAVDGMLASSRNPLPAEVDPVSAALSINQREILSVTIKMGLDAHSRVAIVGSGYNGLLFALFCKHFGAERVVMAGSERLRERATASFEADGFVDYRDDEAARQALDLLGGAPTHLVDAVGSFASLELAGKILGKGSAFGVYGIDDVNETVDMRTKMGRGRPALDMGTEEAIRVAEWAVLWQAGFFKRDGMVDRVMRLEEINEAFEILMEKKAVKIVISM